MNGQSEHHLSHAQKRRSPHTSPRGVAMGVAGAVQAGQAAEPNEMPMPHWAPPGMSHAGSAPQVSPSPFGVHLNIAWGLN